MVSTESKNPSLSHDMSFIDCLTVKMSFLILSNRMCVSNNQTSVGLTKSRLLKYPSVTLTHTIVLWFAEYIGAGLVQRWCNGLSRDGQGFDSRWDQCKKRASRPLQGTVNGGASLNDLTVGGT